VDYHRGVEHQETHKKEEKKKRVFQTRNRAERVLAERGGGRSKKRGQKSREKCKKGLASQLRKRGGSVGKGEKSLTEDR